MHKKEKVKDTKVSKFSYVIKVAEFYFFENAKDLKRRIITETDIQIVNILFSLAVLNLKKQLKAKLGN